VVLTEREFRFSLIISHLLAKAIPARGAIFKEGDVHGRLLFAFLSVGCPSSVVHPRSLKTTRSHTHLLVKMLVMVVRLRFYQQTGDAVMPLTDTKVKNAKPLEKEYKLTDGFGMLPRVTPKGSKYWQMAYRF